MFIGSQSELPTFPDYFCLYGCARNNRTTKGQALFTKPHNNQYISTYTYCEACVQVVKCSNAVFIAQVWQSYSHKRRYCGNHHGRRTGKQTKKLHKSSNSPKNYGKQGFLRCGKAGQKNEKTQPFPWQNWIRSNTKTLFARACLYDTMTATEPI